MILSNIIQQSRCLPSFKALVNVQLLQSYKLPTINAWCSATTSVTIHVYMGSTYHYPRIFCKLDYLTLSLSWPLHNYKAWNMIPLVSKSFQILQKLIWRQQKNYLSCLHPLDLFTTLEN